MKLARVWLAVGLVAAMGAWAGAEGAPGSGPATATRPAASAPATGPGTSTKPATTAAARRAVPINVGGRADPRAPSYIVLFEETVDAKAEVARLEKLHNFKATHTYNMGTFKGFAGVLTAEAVEKLRWDPAIKSIEHDGVATINGGGMNAN